MEEQARFFTVASADPVGSFVGCGHAHRSAEGAEQCRRQDAERTAARGHRCLLRVWPLSEKRARKLGLPEVV